MGMLFMLAVIFIIAYPIWAISRRIQTGERAKFAVQVHATLSEHLDKDISRKLEWFDPFAEGVIDSSVKDVVRGTRDSISYTVFDYLQYNYSLIRNSDVSSWTTYAYFEGDANLSLNFLIRPKGMFDVFLPRKMKQSLFRPPARDGVNLTIFVSDQQRAAALLTPSVLRYLTKGGRLRIEGRDNRAIMYLPQKRIAGKKLEEFLDNTYQTYSLLFGYSR